jgi:hypothetical protein
LYVRRVDKLGNSARWAQHHILRLAIHQKWEKGRKTRMRSKFVLICLLLVVSVSVANASLSWTTKLGVQGVPGSWIDVLTTATDHTTYWTWTYALTPVKANGIQSVRINLLAPEAGMVIPFSNGQPTGWTFTKASKYVAWDTIRGGPYTLDSNQFETFTFKFDHPWGPVELHTASAQDGYGFYGPVYGPVRPEVPEPMTLVLGMMGLGTVSGFRRLRKS